MNHPSLPRRRGSRLLARCTGTVAAVAAVCLGVGLAPAAAAIPVPAPVTAYTTAPEPWARYSGQVICTSTAQPGTTALASVIKSTYAVYGAQSIGTTRACSSGGKSEHKDGRALDWALDVNDPADRNVANAFLGWLLGADAQGVAGGNARRLGVMYVIWNKHSWNAYDKNPTWVPYTGANPHTDHIHISLSWDGALKRTSFWTGVATSRYDYGPCQIWIGEPVQAGPHYDRCPTPRYRPGTAFPKRWDADATADVVATGADGRLLLYPGTGAGGLRTGYAIGKGWQTMSAVTGVGDLDRDGRRDLLARRADGYLVLYRGDGAGSFLGSTALGRGWGGMDTILGASDLDQDGVVDVLARRSADGALLLYRGNGTGSLLAGTVVADTSANDLVRAVGDWDGDGLPDVLTRVRATGELQLRAGDGRGGLGSPEVIGTGWGGQLAVVGTGDFSGDGKADLLTTSSSGRLTLFPGDGAGGFGTAALVGKGWGAITLAN